MTLMPYTFLVLRYVHDRGAGESLNVGVLMHSAESSFIDGQFEHRYERLSQTFNHFNGEQYRQALTRIRALLTQVQGEWRQDLPFPERPRRLQQVLKELWSDEDTSFQWSAPLQGVTSDPQEELAMLFDRMVTSQAAAGDEYQRRDDETLWRRVYQQAIPDRVVRHLRPKRFVTRHVEIEFDRALKNGQWHVVQPLSMDFKNADTMQRKATQWVGTSVGLKGAPDLGTIYFLLGRPDGGSKHRKAYERAKTLLDQAPVKHEIIEEDGAEHLARELGALIHEPE